MPILQELVKAAVLPPGYTLMEKGYKGYKYLKNFTKNSSGMPVSRRVRTEKFRQRRKKRKQPKSTRSRMEVDIVSKPSKSVGNRIYKHENDGSGVTTAASKRNGTRVKREGVKKTVKVSANFRKKVKQSLESDACYGTMMEINTQLVQPITDEQYVAALGRNSGNVKQYFDPCYVLNVCSQLFNNKSPVFNPTIGDSGNFAPTTFQAHVIKQSVTHRMKNNTARHLTIKVYDVSPKGVQYSNGFDAVTYWREQMQNEAAAGDVNTRVNISTATPNTLYAKPKYCKGFMNRFTIDETIVNLEPGKEYNHKVEGPNHMDYKFQKFWDSTTGNSGVFANQQKFVKMTFVVVHGDLVTGIAQDNIGMVAGRRVLLPGTNNEIYGLVVESTVYTKVKVPEQAGFNVPAGALPATMPLHNRKTNPYILKNWTVSSAGTSLGTNYVEINDDQPMTDGPQQAQ